MDRLYNLLRLPIRDGLAHPSHPLGRGVNKGFGDDSPAGLDRVQERSFKMFSREEYESMVLDKEEYKSANTEERYSQEDYEDAKRLGMDLDNWHDHERYYGIGEEEESY